MATRSADKRRSAAKKEEVEKEESTSKAEARSKLNKALENVEGDLEKEKEQQSESSDQSEKEKVPAKKIKVKAEKEEKPAVKEKEMKAPSSKAAKQAPASASYIMKLFDRSVNLAKFDEETPLYPLCRAWMQNSPRQMTIKTESNPEPAELPSDEGDVVEMPKVRIRKGKPLVQRKEIKVNKTDFDKVIDSEVWTKEKLLEFHRGRWTEERKKHIENSSNFEEKHFAANLELLDSLCRIEE